MAASRSPRTSARSASVAPMREPPSNSTRVAGMRDNSAMRARRCADFAGRKPSNRKRSVGSPGGDQRRQHRRGAGQGGDRQSRLVGLPHELVAGIGDRGRAGIRDQRDGCALRDPSQQGRAHCRRIVVVVGGRRRCDAVMVQQLAADAGVLAGNQVRRRERLQGAHRDVAEISDRGRDEIKAAVSRGAAILVPPI